MKHEIKTCQCEINDIDITFETIYSKPYISPGILKEIKNANVLLIPEENFREDGDVLFPETTIEFYTYLKEKLPKDAIVDIAISNNDFQRIELHSDAVIVTTIIINSFLYNVICSVISSYLYDLAKKYLKKTTELSAKVQIIVEETENKKSKIIKYEGPVSEVEKFLSSATKNIFKDEANDNK